MPYQPIENYGVIGNMRTAALVGMNGSIDWYCFPAFDSPSVFAAILDDKKGGSFSIAPATEHTAKKQFYWPDTNVLVTRFFSTDGVGQITDFMPVGVRKGDPGYEWLIRRVSVARGHMKFRSVCRPAFDYARAPHEIERKDGCVRFRSQTLALELSTEVPVRIHEGAVTSEFPLKEGESVSFVLRPADGIGGGSGCVSDAEAQALFESTVEYWRRWLSACTYFGRWREMVQRSALALKLLTYEPSGAMVAAVTCSLPEDLGGGRNWDYRYTWIRDAAFTMYAFMRIGFVEEAGHFMEWLSERCHELGPDGSLQILFRVDGRPVEGEETLDHLDGYKGSRPVRIGNGAVQQLQLDIYGELMDSVYLYNKYGSPISDALWQHLRRLTNWVCDHWRETDEGIWEVRGGRRHFVYSKLRVLGGRRPRAAPDAEALLPVRLAALDLGPGRDLRRHHEERLEREAQGLRPVLRERQPRRLDPDDAARVLRLPHRPAHAVDPGRDQPLAFTGGPRLQQPRLPLRPEAHARRDPG